MQRFTKLLADGMQKRNHQVQIWFPKAYFYLLPCPAPLKKWLGYIDQFVIFPLALAIRLFKHNNDTLFVFTDHALGPYIPILAKKKHVIHCHDFLAQKSALGQIPENPTSFSGRLYQLLIRKGYSKGRNFISVSNATKNDLHNFHCSNPSISTVVYNGLNKTFCQVPKIDARIKLSQKAGIDVTSGYLLHVGGNDWYKNRSGVIEIYTKWCSTTRIKLPLILIGTEPDTKLLKVYQESPYRNMIHFMINPDDETLNVAYSGASIFLFPSLEEGFGWPIAEAMAAGCPVITTDQSPMTEVGGTAAFYIPRRPYDSSKLSIWTDTASDMINKVLALNGEDQNTIYNMGIKNSMRFDLETTLDEIELNYYKINASS